MTSDYLKTILQYTPSTGEFRWTTRRGSRAASGAIAGTVRKKSGYRIIQINKKLYLAHRLAWLYVYGYFPKEDVDHIDQNPRNNTIENLREATRAQNRCNTPARSDNKLAVKGVYKRGKKYAAQIQSKGKKRYLGTYSTIEAAEEAYKKAAEHFHGKFAFHL